MLFHHSVPLYGNLSWVKCRVFPFYLICRYLILLCILFYSGVLIQLACGLNFNEMSLQRISPLIFSSSPQ